MREVQLEDRRVVLRAVLQILDRQHAEPDGVGKDEGDGHRAEEGGQGKALVTLAGNQASEQRDQDEFLVLAHVQEAIARASRTPRHSQDNEAEKGQRGEGGRAAAHRGDFFT